VTKFIKVKIKEWHCWACKRWYNAEDWGVSGGKSECPRCLFITGCPPERDNEVWAHNPEHNDE